MPSPNNDPRLRHQWQELEQQCLDEGLSRHAAHKQIASAYQTTPRVVYYWLTPASRERQKQYLREYRQRPVVAQRLREYRRLHYRMRRARAPPAAWEAQKLRTILPDLKRIFDEAFDGEERLPAEDLWAHLGELSEREDYQHLMERIHQLLPAEEVRPGVYRMKPDWPVIQDSPE